MTRNAFFHRLHKEGVLRMVPPSEEMKIAYLKKSESHPVSARLLLDNDLFEQSVSMSYYSMYYSVLALFFATGIKCENHAAAIILLKEIFAVDNTDLERAKAERIDKQYYVTSAPVRDEVIALIRTAETFNADVRNVIDRLTNEKIGKFRIIFHSMIGSSSG